MNIYNDNYETCSETYVTLRIYIDTKNTDELTEYLGVEPSETFAKSGENKFNSWFLSSEGKVNSKDSRRHIDYLADKLLPIEPKIKALLKEGVKMDISCYWLSENGQGGPTLSPQQLTNLANLGIELWFDIY